MENTKLDIALRLPISDLTALIQGRNIAILPRIMLPVGKCFALYPDLNLSLKLTQKKHYSDYFSPLVEGLKDSLELKNGMIKAWAKCEKCQMFDDSESLENLAKATIWKPELFKEILQDRPYLFVAYLRVYLLPEKLEIPQNLDDNKQFLVLPNHLSTCYDNPILEDEIFAQKCQELENQTPVTHSNLENLYNELYNYSLTEEKENLLLTDMQNFFNWSNLDLFPIKKSENDWIKNITKFGNSSDGDNFEKVVRKSLQFLGFCNNNNAPKLKDSLNPEKTGGGGGLDIYADFPYSIVGECKASKYIMGDQKSAVGQLINLGNTHLTTTEYNNCIKFIFTSGQLTTHANNGAIGNKINVMRNETLERLVEIKANFPGLINLFELKNCLENEPFGVDSDDKINEYIDEILNKIEIRSKIINLVKQLQETNLDQLEGAYRINNNSQPLTKQEISEILIELSSPLAGYLGRKKGSNINSDRFYFVRELETML